MKMTEEPWFEKPRVEFTKDEVNQIREIIGELNLNSKAKNPVIVLKYFRFYEIDFNVDDPGGWEVITSHTAYGLQLTAKV